MDKKEQPLLFDNLVFKEPWEKEWKGMPEFIQENLMPVRTLFVHFKDQADVGRFSRLLNQPITPDTKYIWYPKVDPMKVINLIKKEGLIIPDRVNNYGMKLVDISTCKTQQPC